MGQEKFDSLELQDLDDQAFWDKLHGIFAATLKMVKEKAEELGIGIERSTEVWASLLPHFPDQEHAILGLLATLQRLLRQVEAASPNARALRRPGFDMADGPG